MKQLPIGEPNFAKIIQNNWLYIDKTRHLFDIINSAGLYFLSRPRRFGKSLTTFTLKELLEGNKEMFKGLWIYDNYDFPQYPVIRISFSSLDYKKYSLGDAISFELKAIAESKGIELKTGSYSLQFKELIRKLSAEKPVAILIDEYDKPIVDFVDNQAEAEKNKDTLKSFYAPLKDLTAHIKLLFITGVSKFSGVSIFSDLNNLNDITFDNQFATMLGYTQEELENYFPEHIEQLQRQYPDIEVMDEIKSWYNGYSWNGRDFVYNPFSILLLFSKVSFGDYWFRTGTPTFLVKLINRNRYTPLDIENKRVHRSIFEKHSVEKMEINSLLLQTGYLTIKEHKALQGTVLLDVPNKEVDSAFSHHLLSEFTNRSIEKNSSDIIEMTEALERGDIEEFMAFVRDIFSNLTYYDIETSEKYFHSIFYVIIKIFGYTTNSQVLTNRGRIDCVIESESSIYIIEFKVGKAETALNQIIEKGYAEKYRKNGKNTVLLGIGFDPETRNVGDWLVKKL